MTVKKQRIEYLDFMKGMCILLIVGQHISPESIYGDCNHMLMSFRIPLYYFLSGLFFKTYDGFSDFLRRKVNNILVPFAFFYLMACGLAIVCSDVLHLDRLGLIGDTWEWKYLLDPFYLNDYHYSVALWFLLSLFWVNILYYLLQKVIKGVWIYVAVVALSVAGWLMARGGVMLPMMLDTALVALPFFVLGREVKTHGGLEKHSYDKWGLVVLLPVLVILYLFAEKINIHVRMLPNYFMLYLMPFMAIISLFWFCKNLPHIPVITYIGRYSLVVLGTQSIILGPVRSVVFKLLGESYGSCWLVLLAMVLLELAIIPIMIRLFPKFTAQEPLIKGRQQ